MLSLQRSVRYDLCRLSTAACVSRQILLPLCSLKKMNPAQKLMSSSSEYSSITAGKPCGNVSSAEEARKSSGATIINEKKSQSSYEKDFPSLSVNIGSSSEGRNFNKRRSRIDSGLELREETVNSYELEGIANVASLQEEHSLLNKRRTRIDSGLQPRPRTVNSSEHEEGIVNIASLQEEHPLLNRSRTRIDTGLQPRLGTVNSSEHEEGIVNIASMQEEHSLPSHFGKKKVYSRYVQKSPSSNSKSKNVGGTKSSDCSEDLPKVERFNICLPRFRDFETQEVLRPGMVLLKRYISLREQINIVKTCQTLGEGPGGFYRPGYKDGAKLKLHMMCLGLNWDPQTRKYDKQHPVDNCEPPNIPLEFHLLVQRAIQDAHCLIKKDSHIVNPEAVLPSMSPNICIVNFYSIYGRLGLHQDRDESRESLHKGLPVVSLSIGDSAEFLYGDGREVDQAAKVLLESGDVLLFGGESRMVFHGVPSIVPFSAPEPLLAESGLRHGRLNLTFRQY